MRYLLAPDLSAPTGGNRYDAELVRRGLVRHLPATTPAQVREALAAVPAGATALLDGLVTSPSPDLLAAHRGRVRLVLLVHLLRADDDTGDDTGEAHDGHPDLLAAEVRSLRLADAVVVTSRSSARRVREVSGVGAVVAEPGADPARPALGRGAHRLLCVGTVGPRKGQRLVADAVAGLGGPWTLRCAGTVAEGFTRPGTTLLGPLGGAALQAEWDRADLHVLLSRAEPYGMAVAEGLRRGVPSLVSAEGELPDLVGPAGLVSARTVPAVQEALERWAASAPLRHRLRAAALARPLPTWEDTARIVGAAL